MYLLPAIDILDGKAVRLAEGDYARVTTYNANPVEQAKVFEDAGASWIHVVDLDGAKSGLPENAKTIECILSQTSLKVEVGGGIRNMQTLHALDSAGATRMVLGTALVKDPDFALAAVAEYSDRLACGVDARNGEVAVHGWTEGAGIQAAELARSLSDIGYCHMVFTDIARDGMQTGIDVAAYKEMSQAFAHPVIASGGIATLADIQALIAAGNAVEGAITGRAIYEGTLDLREALELCGSQEIE